MNAQIRIQQPMQKASQMKVENLDHLGLIAGLIDEIGIVQKINALYTAPNLEMLTNLRWLTRVPLSLKQAQQNLMLIRPVLTFLALS